LAAVGVPQPDVAAAGAGRGQQRTVGAQVGQPLDAAQLAQGGDELIEPDAMDLGGGDGGGGHERDIKTCLVCAE
jgi:hypothetical protein